MRILVKRLWQFGTAMTVISAVVLVACVVAAEQQLDCTSRTLLAAPCWYTLWRAEAVGAVAILAGLAGAITMVATWIAGRRETDPN
jgi:hypothetical protein